MTSRFYEKLRLSYMIILLSTLCNFSQLILKILATLEHFNRANLFHHMNNTHDFFYCTSMLMDIFYACFSKKNREKCNTILTRTNFNILFCFIEISVIVLPGRLRDKTMYDKFM